MIERIPSTAIPWILIAASVSTLAGALFFEHVLGYIPCSLCLQGRAPHYFAIGAALIAGILSREANIGIGALIFLGLCVLAYAAGAGISAYHIGVEQKWWEGPVAAVRAARWRGRWKNYRPPLTAASTRRVATRPPGRFSVFRWRASTC